MNETELMFRTKGMAGFTLYPCKAYMEIKKEGCLIAHRFRKHFSGGPILAVKVNKRYQSVFPPMYMQWSDHGKRDVSDFPIATGTYYKG